jgi:hypothetical protein
MDVHLTNPDLQAKLDRWVTETGRGPDELVEDARPIISTSWPKPAKCLTAATTI